MLKLKPITLALSLSLVLAFAWSRIDVIAPVELTESAMLETFARINNYTQTNQAIPLTLQVLPRREGYDNRTTDGWGRPLHYRVGEDGIITLTSFGADGKAGGRGEDADIFKSYHSKRPDGSLWAGAGMWIVEAKVK